MDSILMIMFASLICTMTALTFMEVRRIRKRMDQRTSEPSSHKNSRLSVLAQSGCSFPCVREAVYKPGPSGYAGKSGGRGASFFGFSWIDFIII